MSLPGLSFRPKRKSSTYSVSAGQSQYCLAPGFTGGFLSARHNTRISSSSPTHLVKISSTFPVLRTIRIQSAKHHFDFFPLPFSFFPAILCLQHEIRFTRYDILNCLPFYADCIVSGIWRKTWNSKRYPTGAALIPVQR